MDRPRISTHALRPEDVEPGMVVYTVPFDDWDEGDPQWARVMEWDFEEGTTVLEGIGGDVVWDHNVYDYPGRLLVRCDDPVV